MSLIRNVCCFGFLIGISLGIIETFTQDSLSRRKDNTIKTYADLRRK